jgi:hypothetical protein
MLKTYCHCHVYETSVPYLTVQHTAECWINLYVLLWHIKCFSEDGWLLSISCPCELYDSDSWKYVIVFRARIAQWCSTGLQTG